MRIAVGLAAAAIGLSASALAQNINRPATEPFKDVLKDHWAYQAVESLRQKGIINGYPDGAFRGKRTITRYEAAKGLDSAFGRLHADPAFPSGPPGPRGKSGPQGPQGPAGVSPAEISTMRHLLAEMQLELHRLNDEIETASRRTDALTDEAHRLRRSVSPFHR